MARKLPKKDVVIIGLGWTGSIIANELTDEGLDVIAIERGPWRDAPTGYPPNYVQDELRYRVRHELFLRPDQLTFTFRNKMDQTALPIRSWGAFMPPNGVGGGGVHWNAEMWRFLPSDFVLKTHLTERYGAAFLPPDLTIQDWGVTYDELEPHYDRFEYLLGTSGKAGNLKGQIQPGGDPHESPRSRDYPTPPQKEHYSGALFRKAASSLGYHPFPQPSSNLSQPYTNPEGLKMNICVFCGFCERYACEHYAKSTPQTFILPVLLANSNFELRTGCQVQRINLDSSKKRATGVTYIDNAGRELEQPASLVITCLFAINNIRMLLLSGIGRPYDPATGKGVGGRNYAYQTMSTVASFFDEDVIINPFMASGASGTMINDYAGDNFDHSGLGFIGGAFIGAVNTNGRPIQYHPTPPGTPTWGKGWKEAVVKHYNHTVMFSLHGSSVSQKQNYADLDPTYKDAWGQPLLRITFDFPKNDLKMAEYVTARGVEIGKAMGAKKVVGAPRKG